MSEVYDGVCIFLNYRKSSITLKGGHHLFITFMKET